MAIPAMSISASPFILCAWQRNRRNTVRSIICRQVGNACLSNSCHFTDTLTGFRLNNIVRLFPANLFIQEKYLLEEYKHCCSHTCRFFFFFWTQPIQKILFSAVFSGNCCLTQGRGGEGFWPKEGEGRGFWPREGEGRVFYEEVSKWIVLAWGLFLGYLIWASISMVTMFCTFHAYKCCILCGATDVCTCIQPGAVKLVLWRH